MAIAHELSSDIATALYAAKKRSPRELNDLKDLLFKIHSTLQQLTDDARLDRYRSQSAINKASKEN